MEVKKSHSLLARIWRTIKRGGIIQSESEYQGVREPESQGFTDIS